MGATPFVSGTASWTATPSLTRWTPRAGADSLLASTLYLMGRYAAGPCPRLATLVDRHLAAVARHPGSGALVRETSRRLAGEWTRLRAGCPLGFDAPPCEEVG